MLSVDRTVSLETLIDHDNPSQKWKWQRKLKVAILTLGCIVMTVFLLFLPEARTSTSIVTVSKQNPIVYDLDKTYREQGRSSEKMLRVTLRGSFVASEFRLIVPDQLFITAKADNTSLRNISINPLPWIVGLVPPEYYKITAEDQSVESHGFDIRGAIHQFLRIILNSDS
jgi:hypothetical protein